MAVATALSLAAELTSSSTRDDDLTDKVVVYGRAGIPVYLLLDMQEETGDRLLDALGQGLRIAPHEAVRREAHHPGSVRVHPRHGRLSCPREPSYGEAGTVSPQAPSRTVHVRLRTGPATTASAR